MSEDFEQLGKDFQDNLKEFILKSDNLKKNQLHRVTKALAAYPLENELIKLVHQEELDAYELGVQIQSIKLNLMIESLKMDAEDDRIERSREERKNKEGDRIPDHIKKPDYTK